MPQFAVLNKNIYEYDFDEKFDLIIVNPKFDDSNDNFIALYSKLADCVKDEASVLVVTDWQNQYRIQSIIERKTKWSFCNCIIWQKPSIKQGYTMIMHYSPQSKINSRLKNAVLREDSVVLASDLISGCTGEESAILDCFAGSGEFACSAKSLDRHYLGFEASEKRYNSIMERVGNMLPENVQMEEPGEMC